MLKKKTPLLIAAFSCLWIAGDCGSSGPSQPPVKSCQGSLSLPPLPTHPDTFSGILFTPLGQSVPASNLIDLEILPGQNGDALVIGKDGNVYYVKNDFSSFLTEPNPFAVEDDGEQGMLNVAATAKGLGSVRKEEKS